MRERVANQGEPEWDVDESGRDSGETVWVIRECLKKWLTDGHGLRRIRTITSQLRARGGL